MEVATEIGKFLECGDLSPRPVDDFQLRRLRQVQPTKAPTGRRTPKATPR